MYALLDGGFGTQLQLRGLQPGEIPEDWNIVHPDVVQAIHAAYVQAGSQIVYSNTFGANSLKYHGRYRLEEIVPAAIVNARSAGARVALDIGPTGALLKPCGDLDFERAYEAFAQTIRLGAAAGADCVVVETMSDTMELKAAVLAAKENCSLPVFATVTLSKEGTLLTGGSPESVAVLLEGLRVDALGFNCGLGPDSLLPYVRRLRQVTDLPLIAKPNAGMPQVVQGKTVFPLSPEAFACEVCELVEAGVAYVGGCCGTTPAHIAALRARLAQHPPTRESHAPPPVARVPRISSSSRVLAFAPGKAAIVGERINPTGKKRFREALKAGDIAYVLREAVTQREAGAHALDVNCGVPGIDEPKVLERVVMAVQGVSDLPLALDTSDPRALECALRHVNGKPLVNSVNATRASMDAVFPLVAKYGGVVVALTLDESGIPPTAQGRLDLARKILAEGAKWGLLPHDFLFDALTMAVSAEPLAACVTLETVERLTHELHVNTILGVSNVSFGLPARPELNAAMLSAARQRGLSAAIYNPALVRENDDPVALAVLLGKDKRCAAWIAAHLNVAPAQSVCAQTVEQVTPQMLERAVCHGLGEDAIAFAKELLNAKADPLSLVDQGIVPALERVGKDFEAGRLFLPQLLMAAEAAGMCFEVLRSHLGNACKAQRAAKSPIILATVKGDIHDIGKNIVRSLLENYGFDVIDLGRDVAPETILERVQATGCRFVGLSALMTTTVPAMAETIRLLHAHVPDCQITVGGAVLTADCAREIGADFYTADAMACVRLAERELRIG